MPADVMKTFQDRRESIQRDKQGDDDGGHYNTTKCIVIETQTVLQHVSVNCILHMILKRKRANPKSVNKSHLHIRTILPAHLTQTLVSSVCGARRPSSVWLGIVSLYVLSFSLRRTPILQERICYTGAVRLEIKVFFFRCASLRIL